MLQRTNSVYDVIKNWIKNKFLKNGCQKPLIYRMNVYFYNCDILVILLFFLLHVNCLLNQILISDKILFWENILAAISQWHRTVNICHKENIVY